MPRFAKPASILKIISVVMEFGVFAAVRYTHNSLTESMSAAHETRNLFIPGPVGRLEAILWSPSAGTPAMASIVCHPHPLFGGTMHNKVVYRIARGFRKAGAVVLRFNFRGVNLSEGAYGHGFGEVEDARAALAWLRERYPDLPYSLAGFSFGSRIVLRLGCDDAEARRVVAVGAGIIRADSPRECPRFSSSAAPARCRRRRSGRWPDFSRRGCRRRDWKTEPRR